MKQFSLMISSLIFLLSQNQLSAHCQMPCGIYHDDMVFDQIDQYVETMYKGISVLNNNKFSNPKERNEFIRWVIEKEQASDEVASLLNSYFLQQKIKGNEPDTDKRLKAVHNLLTRCVAIKQNADLKFVEDFSDEWEKFKLLFHRKGYECDLEKIRLQKEAARRAAAGIADDHDHDHPHDHDHDHDHSHTVTPIVKP
ncbi:MAG: superoxide dismutase [Ni] [Parachlamydiaceae bacterium]